MADNIKLTKEGKPRKKQGEFFPNATTSSKRKNNSLRRTRRRTTIRK